MRSVVLLAVALLLSSCKPYARQTSELWSTADKDLTLKLVAHQDNSSLATLVVCLAMDLSRGDAEGEGDYASHSLYSRADGETCFYALHDTRETNTPYYFANPRMEVQTGNDNTVIPIEEEKRGRNLLVSGVVIIGAATAIYMTTRSNSLFKKIRELEIIKSNLLNYNTLQSPESQANTSAMIKFRDNLDALIKDLPNNDLRTSLQKYLDGEDLSRAISDTTNTIGTLTKDESMAKLLMIASMLGVGAVSAFVFIDELRNRKPLPRRPLPKRKASALEELFKDHDMVTLSNEELWHTLRLLNSHLPARINPDLISLKGLFDVNIGSSM